MPAERPEVSRDQVVSWARIAARAADDKKGLATVILDVGAVLAITDFFVITSAPNARLVRTIAEAVEEQIKLEGGPSPIRVEGRDQPTWVLIDYGDLVVHVFLEETRAFYDLERLWRDVPRVTWTPAASAPESSTPSRSAEEWSG